jgi:phosphate-selective porin OprO and OprP
MNVFRSTIHRLFLITLITACAGLAVASTDPAQAGNVPTPAPAAVSGCTGSQAVGSADSGLAPAVAAASGCSASQTAVASTDAAQVESAGRAPAPATSNSSPNPTAAPSTDAKTTEPTIQQLEEKIDELDRKLREDESKEAAPAGDATPPGIADAANTVGVTANVTGFTIASGDGNFLIKFGADLQMDNRAFLGKGAAGLIDNALLRRARPVISGTIYKYVDYFFRPDFGQGTVVIYDAYAELKYFSHFKLRVGKFKPPVGLERLQSDDDTSFVERGLPTLLVPSRDIGFQLSGDFLNRRATYAVGVFNGVADNGLSDAAVSDHRDYSARLFLSPFQPDHNVLSGLGFGMGSSFGNVDGEALPSYKTFGQNSFLGFASGVTEAGHRTRLAPGMYYYLGPFGLEAEYGLTEEGLQKGVVREDVAFRAWSTSVSYVLTGEKKGFGSPTPKKVFDPKNGGWGAVELAARVGEFSAEQGLYSFGFASYTTSPRLIHEVVGGINWYLNQLFRVSLDYGHTTFENGETIAAGLNRQPEDVLILRFQIDFVRTSQSWAYRPD